MGPELPRPRDRLGQYRGSLRAIVEDQCAEVPQASYKVHTAAKHSRGLSLTSCTRTWLQDLPGRKETACIVVFAAKLRQRSGIVQVTIMHQDAAAQPKLNQEYGVQLSTAVDCPYALQWGVP